MSLILAGVAASTILGFASVLAHGEEHIAQLAAPTERVLAGSGVTARFVSGGWQTRHPTLEGGASLTDPARAALALQVAQLDGVGGVRWAPRSANVRATLAGAAAATPVDKPDGQHCQQDVDAALKARSLRFAESSARIDPASIALLDEVAAALRPCQGSVIAISGHTDAAGDEPANLRLSQDRAEAVRAALVARGIPALDLRARGLGSARPLAGLEASDPANRRIEFAVVTIKAVRPTPIDTPGPG